MRLVKPNWVTHDGSPIFSVDIHPDGYRFATGGQGGDSGRVVIWNLEPVLSEEAEADPNIPKMLCQLDHHIACVNCVRWSNKGQLASAGDDKLVMIWKFESKGASKSMFGSANVESWRCVGTLRAHAGDILDLAWAPSSLWLASASVDNTVVVWNVELKTILAVLRGHTGLVKGVTWDPIGRFLASQSDDKSLRIWKTDDWTEETLITDPFEECGGTTHVLRLSWSPDGQYLVSAHAMNGGGPTAQIIERDGWKTDKDYVGHRKAVTCVRFNGKILQKSIADKKPPIQFCCVAIGSRDRSLSVWSTYLKRPVVVINELFVASVLDISWSSCGMRLCACSKDGTVVFIEFSEAELGQPVDSTTMGQIKEKLYGKIHPGTWRIVEVPELLDMRDDSPPKTTARSEPMDMAPPAQPSSNKVAKPSSVNTQSTQGPVHKQIETKTTDGKRRITPMFLATTPEPTSSEPGKPGPVASTSFSSSTNQKSSIVVEKREEVVQPNVGATASSSSKPSTSTTASSISSKRIDDILRATKAASEAKKPKVSMERKVGDILIPPLQPDKNFNMLTGHYAVSVKLDKNVYRLQVFGLDNEPLWDQYLGYSATGLATSPTLVAVSLEDGSVHIFFTAKGIRASPPFVPQSPIAKIHAAGSRVMVISSYGDVQVWEVEKTLCRQVISTSAAHLIAPGGALIHSSLMNGLPNLIFANARAYLYHPEMASWLIIGDSQDPILRFAMLNAPSHLTGIKPMGPVGRIQECLNRAYGVACPFIAQPQGPISMIAYMEHMTMASKVLASSTEYEYWILASVNLLCSHERYERRLRIILDDLLGPVHDSAHESTSWEPTILGIRKHQLLEDALKIVAKDLRWQRLYVEYNDQLKTLKDLYKKASE